jgi:hypothetical protein
MKVMKALSLVLLCATPLRIAIAQTGAKEKAEATNQARPKSRSTHFAMASP